MDMFAKIKELQQKNESNIEFLSANKNLLGNQALNENLVSLSPSLIFEIQSHRFFDPNVMDENVVFTSIVKILSSPLKVKKVNEPTQLTDNFVKKCPKCGFSFNFERIPGGNTACPRCCHSEERDIYMGDAFSHDSERAPSYSFLIQEKDNNTKKLKDQILFLANKWTFNSDQEKYFYMLLEQHSKATVNLSVALACYLVTAYPNLAKDGLSTRTNAFKCTHKNCPRPDVDWGNSRSAKVCCGVGARRVVALM